MYYPQLKPFLEKYWNSYCYSYRFNPEPPYCDITWDSFGNMIMHNTYDRYHQ